MTHTVIVGAGIAGLWLAWQLAKRGDRVTLLEKYDYLGGRVVTSKKHGVEIGAGRISKQHHRVHALLRHYGLHTHPLGEELLWWPAKTLRPQPNDFDAAWSAFVRLFARLPPATLATHTLRQLTESAIGPQAATALLAQFPYRAETESARADVALAAFKPSVGEMATHAGYVVVKDREGLSALVAGLERDCRAAGVRIRMSQDVTGIEDEGRTVCLADGRRIHADRVVLALHASALKKLLPQEPKLQHLGMERLVRIYAQYPTPAWFGGLAPVVTDSPLRYVIPVNPEKGTIMISYTSEQDTAPWWGLKGTELIAAIQKEVRRLFGPHVPEPLWVQSYEWSEGCTYWRPGHYDPHTVAAHLAHPAQHLYICGESLSVGRQAWMEGALENAATLIEKHL
jgi:phytoene dehydrogenase-like protein